MYWVHEFAVDQRTYEAILIVIERSGKTVSEIVNAALSSFIPHDIWAEANEMADD